MKLKLWHNSNIGHLPTFERDVPDLETAKVWINLLWDYDLYHYGERVKANASGLLQLNEKTLEWEEWEGPAGDSISMLVAFEREELERTRKKIKRAIKRMVSTLPNRGG